MKKIRKNIWKIGYGFIGVLLLISFIATGSYGLPDIDLQSYRQALEQQSFINTLGFSDFNLIDYPVAVYTGDKDYVLQGNEITTREPALGAFAATAFQVDGGYEIFTPSYRDMSNTVGAISLASGFGQSTYNESTHITVLWHEAFHAWQLTNYEDNINRLLGDRGENDQTLSLDSNDNYRQLFTEEMHLLLNAVHSNSDAERQDILEKWATLTDKYELTPEQRSSVMMYELIEGSAFYVESKLYRQLEGDDAYRESYLTFGGNYSNGTSKYYQSGMLKCMLLDILNPGWQSIFTFDTDLNTALNHARKP